MSEDSHMNEDVKLENEDFVKEEEPLETTINYDEQSKKKKEKLVETEDHSISSQNIKNENYVCINQDNDLKVKIIKMELLIDCEKKNTMMTEDDYGDSMENSNSEDNHGSGQKNSLVITNKEVSMTEAMTVGSKSSIQMEENLNTSNNLEPKEIMNSTKLPLTDEPETITTSINKTPDTKIPNLLQLFSRGHSIFSNHEDSSQPSNFYLSFRKNFTPKKKQFQDLEETSYYSITEDLFIINYIFEYKDLDNRKGIKLYREMSRCMDINDKTRTFYSIKERFLNRILPNIEIYRNEGISPDIIDYFKTALSSDHESEEEEEEIKKRKRGATYGKQEKQRIVNYIIKNEKYEKCKGVALWQKMAFKMENPEKRSWQSLKNVFLKNILPNIKLYTKKKYAVKQFENI